jgi:hypothetical protein
VAERAHCSSEDMHIFMHATAAYSDKETPWERKRENTLIKSYASAAGLLDVRSSLYLYMFEYGKEVGEEGRRQIEQDH